MHVSQKVGLDRLVAVAERGLNAVGMLRQHSLAPTDEKKQPMFTPADLLALLGKNEDWLEYRLKRNEEPMPVRVGHRNNYTLEAMQQWCRKERAQMLRPAGQEGLVLCVGNFKGGSAKTTTAVSLLQGLSIRGHTGLLIDVDGQGSASNLHGVIADLDGAQTIYPICDGTMDDVMPLVRKTYWPGIDLIAASKELSLAEAVLPTKQDYWLLLRKALANARKKYDVIIIDTSPNLGPLTSMCLYAADALIMPVTPNGLDFASSVQYWDLFADIFEHYTQNAIAPLEYEFVRIVLSRVDSIDRANVAMVRGIMQKVYQDFLMAQEIPKSSYVTGASNAFGTVYDAIPNVKTSRRAVRAAQEPYERFVNEIEICMCSAWARRMQEAAQAA